MPLSGVHLHVHAGQSRPHRRNLKIALAGGVREFPADSHFAEWRRQAREFAMLHSFKGHPIVFGIGLAFFLFAVFIAYLPHVRQLLWSMLAWAPLVIAVLVAIGVICNILFAMSSMYIGYRPIDEEPDRGARISPTAQPILDPTSQSTLEATRSSSRSHVA